MKLKTALLIAAAGLSLTACVAITSAPAGRLSGKDYETTLGREWSDISAVTPGRAKKVRVLSVDGPLLNRLYLTEGLAPGEYLIKPAAREKPTPLVRSGMSVSERIEFVAESVAAMDYQRVETARPRPAKFGEADAVRFDLTAKTAEGLDMSGTALAAEHGGKLHVILFLAPTEHYFGAGLKEVESIMGSARPKA